MVRRQYSSTTVIPCHSMNWKYLCSSLAPTSRSAHVEISQIKGKKDKYYIHTNADNICTRAIYKHTNIIPWRTYAHHRSESNVIRHTETQLVHSCPRRRWKGTIRSTLSGIIGDLDSQSNFFPRVFNPVVPQPLI